MRVALHLLCCYVLLAVICLWAGAQLKCIGCCVPAPCVVKHWKPAGRGVLSFLSLLRVFLLITIKRNQAQSSAILACHFRARVGTPKKKVPLAVLFRSTRPGYVRFWSRPLTRGWLPYQANRFSSTKKHLSRCAQPESRCAHRPAPVLSGFLPPKKSVGRVIGRCARRDSGCAHRERYFLNELKVAA